MLSLPVLLLLIVAVGGSAGMVAIFGWLFHRLSRLESQGPVDVRQLQTTIEELQNELVSVRSELGALTERVDFTEKLLEAPRETMPPLSTGRDHSH